MNIDVGKKIYELRRKKNMTQEDLASEMGVSIAAVSKWENNNSIPDIIMLCSLSDFFEVSTDELLGRTKRKKSAVVADDSDFVRDTIKKILNDNDCDVVGEAQNGKQLMKILESKKADCVFLDISMPEMDGMTALEKIKDKFPDTKVIMCSATTDQEVIDHAISLGASGYVTKPFLPEAIVASLNML